MKAKRVGTIAATCVSALMLIVVTVHGDATGWQAPQPAPKADPIMTEELMGRLVKRTLASKLDAVLNMRVSGLFGLNDGKADLPALQVSMTNADGKRAFNVPLKAGFKDIVLMFIHDGIGDVYLTDIGGVLRDAAVLDSTGIRRITKVQADVRYKTELGKWAREAVALPPLGAASSDKN